MFKLEYMVVGNVNFSELTFFLVETMFWSNWIQLLIVDILDDEITYAFFFYWNQKMDWYCEKGLLEFQSSHSRCHFRD